MNAREKWLTTALVALALAFGWQALWQQARHQDAREAVRRYVELNEREEKEDAEQLALIRQARPEIRRSLSRGEFETALKRLKSLEAEDDEAGDAPKTGKGLSIDTLWPPKSEGRKRVETVLQELVKKQGQGYDMVPAQQQLVLVAEAARSGKKEEAVAAFDRAADFVQNAQLRPGFKAPVTLAAAGGGALPAELRVVEGGVRRLREFRRQLPQLMERATPEQRPMLEEVQTLADEVLAAHAQKRDLRPVMAALESFGRELGQALNSQDFSKLQKQIDVARALVKSAPPLPPALVAAQGATPPAAPGVPGAPGPGGAAPGPPGQPGGAPGGEMTAGLLKALDTIRALPEAEYQARKPLIAAMLAQAVRQAGRAQRPGGATPPDGAPGAQGLGQVIPGSGRMPALSLHLEGQPQIQLPGSWTEVKEGQRLHVQGEAGSVTAVLSPTGSGAQAGAQMKIRGERTKDGPPGYLQVAVSAPFGGSYWVGPGGPEVIALDREYQVQSTGDKLPKLTVRTVQGEVILEAPSASAAGYNGKQSLLWVRLPLGAKAGVIEHTVHLTARGAHP